MCTALLQITVSTYNALIVVQYLNIALAVVLYNVAQVLVVNAFTTPQNIKLCTQILILPDMQRLIMETNVISMLGDLKAANVNNRSK